MVIKGSRILFCIGLMVLFSCNSSTEKPFFKISLAQWSLHRTLRSGDLTTLEFPAFVKEKFGIEAVEYVSQFFQDKVRDTLFLEQLKVNAEKAGVKSLLIMVDGEGELGALNELERNNAVDNHEKWIEAASYLGCHSIRVNASGKGSAKEVKQYVVKSLKELCIYAKSFNINVIVENHGGLSSDGLWLCDVISSVNESNCGTLPDFGNFYSYDRYKGVKEMMKFAKGVSAKSNSFYENGEETRIDYSRMLSIVKKSGYKGYIGIEYEGRSNNEIKGVQNTLNLLLSSAKGLSN